MRTYPDLDTLKKKLDAFPICYHPPNFLKEVMKTSFRKSLSAGALWATYQYLCKARYVEEITHSPAVFLLTVIRAL